MAILRNDLRNQYTVVSQAIMRDDRLSLRTCGLLVKLLALPDSWDFNEKGLAKIFKKDGQTSIRSGLKELEECGYLERNKIRNSKGQIEDVEWIIRETPVVKTKDTDTNYSSPNSMNTDYQEADNQSTKNPNLDNPILDNQLQSNTNISNTKNTIYLSAEIVENNKNRKKPRQDSMDKINEYTNLIQDNIEYDILVESNPMEKETIDEMIEIIVEVIASTKDTIRIGGEEKPIEVVKSRFLKLDSSHMDYVLLALSKNTSKVRNIKTYLLTTIYNSLSTKNNYYKLEVQHDLYGTNNWYAAQ